MYYVTSNLMPLWCCLTSNPSQGTHRQKAPCRHMKHPQGRCAEKRGRWDSRAVAQLVRSWQLCNRCTNNTEQTFKRRLKELANKKKWKKEGEENKKWQQDATEMVQCGTHPEESQVCLLLERCCEIFKGLLCDVLESRVFQLPSKPWCEAINLLQDCRDSDDKRETLQ